MKSIATLAVLLMLSSSAYAQTPLTAMTRTPIPGWTCIPHPYTVFASAGWLFCVAPPEQAGTAAPRLTATCELSAAEVIVGTVDANARSLAWLVLVNRETTPQPAELTFYVDDGATLTEPLILRPGRNSVALHERFPASVLTALSVEAGFTSRRITGGVVQRLSDRPWRDAQTAELSACRPVN